MEQLSLDQLLAPVPPHLLDQKITNNVHLEDIARSLGNWKAAVAYLGLSEADEEDIEEENSRVDGRRRALLRKWRSKYGPKATYRNLAKCFYKAEKIEVVETICKILQPVSQSATQYQLPSQYQPPAQSQPAPPYAPAGGYYPPPSGAMYQHPPPSGATQESTSVKMPGTQTPEYQKLQGNFDTIICQLGAAQAAGELADKLFTKKLITSETRERASLATLTNTEKMRVLIPAVIARVEIDPRSYDTFVAVLRAINGAEHVADYLEKQQI